MKDRDGRGSLPPSRPFRTLLGENLGSDYEEFSDGRGMVRLWHLRHHILVFESTGAIYPEHSDYIVGYHARHMKPHPRPWLAFGNWTGLLTYTPEVRRALTEWQVEEAYDELYVAHDSRLLAMGIGLANTLLRNTVVVVPSEEQLDDLFLARRAHHGF